MRPPPRSLVSTRDQRQSQITPFGSASTQPRAAGTTLSFGGAGVIQGLTEKLKDEKEVRDTTPDLDTLISLSISLDGKPLRKSLVLEKASSVLNSLEPEL